MIGDTRLLLGSDYPFSLMDIDPVNSVLSSRLSAMSKETILEHNVAALLKLDI
jgi:predicted TIM-barrel fold metal-dependent hydrolase